MSLRVIAGAARGRRLRVPPRGTRPTAELVRNALLTMLEHRGWLDNATVLDLFAGSGALGIEALSRGAARVVFVEAADAAVRVLRDNVLQSGFSDRAQVLPAAVPAALRRLSREHARFDGVIADPPYGDGWVQKTIDGIVDGALLGPHGWIAIEHRHDEVPAPTGALIVHTSRRHGDTTLTILQSAGGEA